MPRICLHVRIYLGVCEKLCEFYADKLSYDFSSDSIFGDCFLVFDLVEEFITDKIYTHDINIEPTDIMYLTLRNIKFLLSSLSC